MSQSSSPVRAGRRRRHGIVAVVIAALTAVLALAAPSSASATGFQSLGAISYSNGGFTIQIPSGCLLGHSIRGDGRTITKEWASVTCAPPASSWLVLHKSFAFPTEVLETARREGVTGLPLVPTMAAVLLKMKDLRPGPVPTLRYITNAAAALPSSHIEGLTALFPGVKLYSMYGLTECARATFLAPEEIGRRPGSVGKALPGTEFLIIDDSGHQVVPGETGVLVDFKPQEGGLDPANPGQFERDLAAAINKVALDPELRERFGRNGRARVEEHFSWEAIARQTLDLYEALVAASGD